jgi:hypothetical protein
MLLDIIDFISPRKSPREKIMGKEKDSFISNSPRDKNHKN